MSYSDVIKQVWINTLNEGINRLDSTKLSQFEIFAYNDWILRAKQISDKVTSDMPSNLLTDQDVQPLLSQFNTLKSQYNIL